MPLSIWMVNSTTNSVSNAAELAIKPRVRVFYPMVRSKINCQKATATSAQCFAERVVDNNNNPITANSPQELRKRILQTYAPQFITPEPTTSANPAAITVNTINPARLHTAYNLPCSIGGIVQEICPQPTAFGPQAIAIVDAYGYPKIESDMQTFTQYYGLPTCSKANGCLQVVNESGQTSNLPTRTDWIDEITLDVQTAHALCQNCKILLVEASSSSISDLAAATRTAAAMHPTVISLSWGGAENSSSENYASSFNYTGIPVIAASGDSGYNVNLVGSTGVSFPASLPSVVAAGGTTLTVNSDDTYNSESIWNGTGSGCASISLASLNQTSLPTWSQTGCGTKRAVVDMSADADPSTGVGIYFSNEWWYYGGTSLATPIIASAFALDGGIKSTSQATNVLYANYSPANFHDITTGTNGSCSSTMCGGFVGYDGPSGLGTPNGLGAFTDGATVPTATPTATIVPTITLTPTPTPTRTPTPTPTPTGKPPVVSITNPINGSTVSTRTGTTIRANATDATGISEVQFYVNNTLQCTDTTAPYSCSWTPRSSRTKYTLSAKAYDRINLNTTTSITVTSS